MVIKKKIKANRLPKIGGIFKTLIANKVLMWILVVVVLSFIGLFCLIFFSPDEYIFFPKAGIYDVKYAQDLGEEVLNGGFKDDNLTQHTQTLNLLIGGGRINDFYFEDIEVGKHSGLTEAFLLTGGNYYLTCETLILDGLETPELIIRNGSAYSLIIQHNEADGNSFSSTLTSSIPDYKFGSTRGTIDIPHISSSDFDRIIIDSTAGDSICNTFTLKDIHSYGAGITISNFKVGTLQIINSYIGNGSGIDTPNFIIKDSVNATTLLFTNNSELPINVK